MTILNKIVEVEINKKFMFTYGKYLLSHKRNNNPISFLVRKYDPYSKRAYFQLIGSTNHPETYTNKENFAKTLENFYASNIIKSDTIRRDPSRSKSILEYTGPLKTVETWSNHPGLSGERDHIRSNMKKIRHFAVPRITIKEINDRFEREGKPPLEEPEGEIIDKKTGKSLFIVRQGEVEG